MSQKVVQVCQIRYGDIEIVLPKTREGIAHARSMLDIFERKSGLRAKCTQEVPKPHEIEPKPKTFPVPESGAPKPLPEKKIEFFHEDPGFDYRAVQPRSAGGLRVYTNLNSGQLVIAHNHEIVRTTSDRIEKLLGYTDEELNSAIRGIHSQKQNILRIYLHEIKKRGIK